MKKPKRHALEIQCLAEKIAIGLLAVFFIVGFFFFLWIVVELQFAIIFFGITIFTVFVLWLMRIIFDWYLDNAPQFFENWLEKLEKKRDERE